MAGPEISTEESIITIVGDPDDDDAPITETTIRDRGFFEVGSRLRQLPPGNIYFQVTVTGTNAATTDWEIVVTER